MKRSIKNLLFISFTLTVTAGAFAQSGQDGQGGEYKGSECYKEYSIASKKKSDRYSKASKRYHNNRMNAAFSGNVLIQAAGSNLTAPRRDDYNMFESEILSAADYKLGSKSYRPNGLSGFVSKAVEKYPNRATLEKVVTFVRKGFSSGRFCKGLMGKYGINRVEKYVLKQFKAEAKMAGTDLSETGRTPAVNDSDKVHGKSFDREFEKESQYGGDNGSEGYKE